MKKNAYWKAVEFGFMTLNAVGSKIYQQRGSKSKSGRNFRAKTNQLKKSQKQEMLIKF